MAKSRTRHRARTVHVPVWLAHHHGRRSRDLAAIPRGVIHAGQPAIDPRRARGVSSGRIRNTDQSLARRALVFCFDAFSLREAASMSLENAMFRLFLGLQIRL